MQAIYTKYLPSTNYKCSRIKATAERGSVIISFDDGNGIENAHILAAQRLVDKFVTEDVSKYGSKRSDNPWNRKRVVGGLPQGGYAHVFVS